MQKIDESNKLCHGCGSFDDCGIPFHELEEDADRCPCNRCLVKMVCYATPCKEFMEYSNGLRMRK